MNYLILKIMDDQTTVANFSYPSSAVSVVSGGQSATAPGAKTLSFIFEIT